MKTRFLFVLLALPLLAPLVESQAGRHGASSIDTIAGGESASVPGRDFSPLAISGLVADSQGNIYFSIQSKSRVYRRGRDGLVTVFAGNGTSGREIDGVTAAESPLFGPRRLAVDKAGNVYIACHIALVRVDARTRILSTVLETPYSLRRSPRSIGEIMEMAVGPDGNLYFSDGKDSRIKSYSFASGAVTVRAGNGTIGPTVTGIPATSSPLRYPESVAVGSDGTVYFSTLEPRLFRIAPEDGKLQVVNIEPPGQAIPLSDHDIPYSIALDEQGHLFVSQPNRSRVLEVVPQSEAVSVYAGTGQQEFDGDGIPADQASLMPLFVAWPGAVCLAGPRLWSREENRRIRALGRGAPRSPAAQLRARGSHGPLQLHRKPA